MQDDYLKDLRFLGVTARLKRLSDNFSADIRGLYRAAGADIEPSWHLVFLFLDRHRSAGMTELADAFHVTQPAMTKMIRAMKKRGYVEVTTDQYDGRKKVLRLSRKAEKRLPEFRKIWNAGQKSIRDLLRKNGELIPALDKLEEALQSAGFKERALRYLETE